jgi:hypothetical protein
MLINFGKKIEIKKIAYNLQANTMSKQNKNNPSNMQKLDIFNSNTYYPYSPIADIAEKQIISLKRLRNKQEEVVQTETIILEPHTPYKSHKSNIYEPSPLDMNIQKTLEEMHTLENKKNELQQQIEEQTNTLEQQQSTIYANNEILKKQILTIDYNNNISSQILQNMTTYNTEISNKIYSLNVINGQINAANVNLTQLQDQINLNEDYLQQLEDQMNNNEKYLQQLETNIYNSQQTLTNNLSMLGYSNIMFQNPFYLNQMMSLLAGYVTSPEMYEVNEINQ